MKEESDRFDQWQGATGSAYPEETRCRMDITSGLIAGSAPLGIEQRAAHFVLPLVIIISL